MFNHTRLLFILLIFLISNDGSAAQNEPDHVLSEKSMYSRARGFFSDQFGFHGYGAGNDYAVTYMNDDERLGEEYEELSKYEKIKLRIQYELCCSIKRVYNWIFNNSKYQEDKLKDPCCNDGLDNAILGAIVSTTVLSLQLIIYIFKTWYHKYFKGRAINVNKNQS